jgi:protein tyrosine/serine phosphatase
VDELTRAVVSDPPAPLAYEGSAYDAAARVELPAPRPLDMPGLHNVFALGDNIRSGAEPADRGALEELAAWGVKTILSVDGKAPDAETAAELGMRYVHVPIQYDGIDEEELLAIAKTFREQEAPFYVHCFHGRHRGPAAAAIGRVVLDGVPRELALAEMRQWCATSKKYEGLYATVAAAEMPTARETEGFAFDFPAAHRFEGMRAVMIELARTCTSSTRRSTTWERRTPGRTTSATSSSSVARAPRR